MFKYWQPTPRKVGCDLQLTMMANCHYRLLRERIGNGYATARFQHIFLDFINAAANVVIGEHDITLCFEKRAYNPLLAAAGLAKTNLALHRLQNKKLRLTIGYRLGSFLLKKDYRSGGAMMPSE